MLDLKRGDIVALLKGSFYDEVFGVVSQVTDRCVRVDFATEFLITFTITDGVALNAPRAAAGHRILPLDAEVRKSILATGFTYGPCSRRKLERMELRARERRAAMMESAG